MYVVISGSNRPQSLSRRLSGMIRRDLDRLGREAEILDLLQLPPEIFHPDAYVERPASFAPFQEAMLRATGIVTVVPEYNGSYPGVLKYFVDMLGFPESLVGKPVAFVGLSAGPGGGVRAVEQLAMVYQYRKAHLYGGRLFLRNVHALLGEDDRLLDVELAARLDRLLRGFVEFAEAVNDSSGVERVT